MHARHCLNCGNAIIERQRFCPECGQRTDTARLSVADVGRDLMHSFVNIERSLISFAWALLTRPGVVAREYVEGKRRRYYGPFATLTVIVGATALAINLSGYQVLAQDGFDRAPTDLLQRHFNLLLLAQLPLLGCTCLALFRSARLNLFEHMVLAAYALSVRAAFLLLVIPFSILTSNASPSPLSVTLFWTTWFAYFGWAGTQFYGGPRGWSWVRAALAAALTQAAVLLIVLAANRAYQSLAGA
jgi:hypothetical protein